MRSASSSAVVDAYLLLLCNSRHDEVFILLAVAAASATQITRKKKRACFHVATFHGLMPRYARRVARISAAHPLKSLMRRAITTPYVTPVVSRLLFIARLLAKSRARAACNNICRPIALLR